MNLSIIKTALLVISAVVLISSPVMAAEKKEGPRADIKLESNFIGDKEQPSVTYFVPWQGIGTPDKLQWEMTDKIDKTLDRVDRDVFRRSLRIYNEMNLETPNR
ncbi:MAG: hypothetical protein HWE27_07475 [Gammaproteobacteria bacterium]|nr:hypothetical protein [Gammaproteobacteria bacterium]